MFCVTVDYSNRIVEHCFVISIYVNAFIKGTQRVFAGWKESLEGLLYLLEIRPSFPSEV